MLNSSLCPGAMFVISIASSCPLGHPTIGFL
jgi:hypothetical protein